MKLNPESSDEHAKAYQTYGGGKKAVPAIAFVDTEGDPISVVVGYRDAKEFAELMEDTLKGEERFQELKTALKEKPNDLKINAELANIYVKRGNLEKGMPIAEKIFELDSENTTGLLPDIHLNCGLYFARHANEGNTESFYRKAETHFQTVIEKYPKSAVYEQTQFHLSVTFALQKKYEQAIELLEELSDSEDEDIKTHASDMLDRVKNLMSMPSH